MRRKEKQIHAQDEIVSILNRAHVCRVAFSDGDFPYLVPMNFCYKDNTIYLHSSPEGKKISILKKNSNVCFETEIDCTLAKGPTPCSVGMNYRSVIASGKASLITEKKPVEDALHLFVKKYTGLPGYAFTEQMISPIVVIAITIDEITGKKSGHHPDCDSVA